MKCLLYEIASKANFIAKSRCEITTAFAGGERGVRTPDTCYSMHAFQACAFNRSAISPYIACFRRRGHLFVFIELSF